MYMLSGIRWPAIYVHLLRVQYRPSAESESVLPLHSKSRYQTYYLSFYLNTTLPCHCMPAALKYDVVDTSLSFFVYLL